MKKKKNTWIFIPMLLIYILLFQLSSTLAGLATMVGVIVLGIGFFQEKNSKRIKNKAAVLTTLVGIFIVFGIGGLIYKPGAKGLNGTFAMKPKIANNNAAEKALNNGNNVGKVSKEEVSGDLKVHFIDVGQADAILIQQGSHLMLVDGGNRDDGPTVKNYLQKQGITSLDYVVGTHAHEDHIGGLAYIINNFKVGKVYFPKQTATTKTFKDFVTSVKNKGLGLTVPTIGESFNLGQANCKVLAPKSTSYEDGNDYSIVIKVSFGNNSFLLTADAEALSEKEMLSSGADLKSDLLKVAHHGSRTSTTSDFLSKVNPKYAVVSVGRDNSYNHPALDTMNRLKAKGIQVYRTDEQGSIVAISDGKEIRFNVSPGSYGGKISAGK